MSKIIEYKIICATTPDELQVKIREALGGGFQPHGSLCVNPGTGTAYLQPVVMYENALTGIKREIAREFGAAVG